METDVYLAEHKASHLRADDEIVCFRSNNINIKLNK